MATNGNDTIIFTGSLQQLSATLTNAYSGYTISIDEEKNVNNSVYDGMGGTDFLIMSNFGDALFIDDGAGNQTFNNIEIIIAGDGGDVIDLSSTVHIVNNGVIISGGLGDDILWGNVGDDTINGADGHDILDGGPGHDTLQGETGNDYLSGWTGNDTLEGGEGDDILVGGQGNDIYVFDNFGGNDTIIETAGAETNTIQFTNATTQSDLSFSANGDDMIIDLGVNGKITIVDQFAENGSGIDTITFFDGSTFDLRSVPKPNVDPDAQDDSFSGNEDSDITGNVLGNDSDSDGGTVTALAGTFTTVNGGTVTLAENGDFTYTPAADFYGQDSFDYTITDGQGGSDTASVTLDVASVNDDPTAGNDSFSGNEDTAITGNVLGNDSDSDGGTVAAVAGTFTTANSGTVELLENGDFTYTPATDFFGQDSFDYTITDGQGGSDTATVTLDVASVNDDPTAGNDSFSGNEDSDITGNVLGNDSDSDGGTVAAVAGTFTTANGGTVELLENGDFTYTPATDFFGQDSFDYTITDGQGGSDTATVTLDVASVNDDPTAGNDSFSGNEDTAITGNVLGNDSDSDGGTVAAVAGTFTTANGGTVELLENGDFTYTPAADFYGQDSFDYTITDGQGGSDTASVTLDVASVNDDPTAGNDSFSGNEDTVISGNVLGNDSDSDGGTVAAVAGTFTTVNGGTVTLAENGDFTYTPATDFYGQDSFDYTITDGQGGSDTATVTLDVADVVDGVVSNLDIRVSHGNIATKYINSTDGYDISPSAFGITETVDASTMDVAGASSSAQVSYSFIDANTATVTLDSFWNSMKNIEVSSDEAGHITLNNFVHTDVILGNGGNSVVHITDAKRGFITTGDGSDDIRVEAHTNGSGWSNLFDVNSGAGDDTIWFKGDQGITEFKLDTGDGNDDVTLEWDYDVANVNMGDGDDTYNGGHGTDIVSGGAGNDILFGAEGDDKLYGGLGSDHLHGGAGIDLLVGGLGNDTLHFGVDAIWTNGFGAKNVGSINDEGTGQLKRLGGYNRTYDQYEGGDGEDTLQMTDGKDALFIDDMFSPRPEYTEGSRVGDIEIIRAGGGHDVVDLTSDKYDYIDVTIYGDDGNDYLWASSGDDVIYGGTGNDDIYGGLGNDELHGDSGNDTIRGAGGDDIIYGGEGNDKLYGGDGADIFVFEHSGNNNRDTIYDFDAAEGDALDISNLLSGYNAGSDDIADFVKIVTTGNHTSVSVNNGQCFEKVATLQNTHIGTDITDLINNGTLIIDQNTVI